MWDLIVSVPDHCLSFYFLDGNGMNSFSCKDTKHGAQLTLIDKNVI